MKQAWSISCSVVWFPYYYIVFHKMLLLPKKDMTEMDEVLPLVAMLIVTCLDIGLLVIVKAAMNGGLESIVYVVYHNALATIILFPFFIFHILRKTGRPPITFRILFRFFILGILGLCLYEVLAYLGVNYSSPTMASAIGNLAPGITFLVALVFRMERIDIKTSSSGAKLLGTVIALSGAMVLTFYQGPEIFHTLPHPDRLNQQQPLSSQPSNWVFGGLIIFYGCNLWLLMECFTNKNSRRVPRSTNYCLFHVSFWDDTVYSSISFHRTKSKWLGAVVFGAVHSTVFRCTVVIWCLRKRGPVFVAMFSPLSIVIAIIMGVGFLGDSLYLGSAIGAMIISTGFYAVIWGETKEKDKLHVVVHELGSSDQTNPLLSSRNESIC